MEVLNFEPIIPFRQKIDIDNTEFEFEFTWRRYDDTVILNIYKDDKLVIENEELRYGRPLFGRYMPDSQGNIRRDLPQKVLIPLNQDGVYTRCGIKTLFTDIQIAVFDVSIMKTRIGGN